MGYDAARTKMEDYRKAHLAGLLGESRGTWFSDLWGSLQGMLADFTSDKENQEITSSYATAPSLEKVSGHLKLNYVCGLRREVRKQYLSGEDGLYTDVTPFKHGVISTHGAQVFDNALDAVMKNVES